MRICQSRCRWMSTLALAGAILVPGVLLAGCDQETSTSKSSSSKVVDTPDGKKKVTETTETTTTKERKDAH